MPPRLGRMIAHKTQWRLVWFVDIVEIFSRMVFVLGGPRDGGVASDVCLKAVRKQDVSLFPA
jgi:uncharacterized protein YijF (DUF1287 family)